MQNKRHRRGDVREDGKLFWCYHSCCKNGERWLTIEKFEQYRKNINKNVNRNHKKRIAENPLSKMKHNVRTNIAKALSRGGYTKKSKAMDILGCNYNEFSIHIEAQFAKGMTWKNQGKWHFDHILPIVAAKTESDVIKLNHYTNFQPLWELDNLRKGDSYDPEELKAYLAA